MSLVDFAQVVFVVGTWLFLIGFWVFRAWSWRQMPRSPRGSKSSRQIAFDYAQAISVIAACLALFALLSRFDPPGLVILTFLAYGFGLAVPLAIERIAR